MAPHTGCTAIGEVLRERFDAQFLPPDDVLAADGTVRIARKHTRLQQLLDAGLARGGRALEAGGGGRRAQPLRRGGLALQATRARVQREARRSRGAQAAGRLSQQEPATADGVRDVAAASLRRPPVVEAAGTDAQATGRLHRRRRRHHPVRAAAGRCRRADDPPRRARPGGHPGGQPDRASREAAIPGVLHAARARDRGDTSSPSASNASATGSKPAPAAPAGPAPAAT